MQYIDGLGRPTQTITLGGSPDGFDIVAPAKYDALGRQPVSYMPYTLKWLSDGPLGTFRTAAITGRNEQQAFYDSIYPGEGQYARSTKYYDNSPLNRVIEVSSPGEAWREATGHTVKSDAKHLLHASFSEW